MLQTYNDLGHYSGMCNLHSVTKGRPAIRELYRAMHDRTGNMPLLPGVFPNTPRRSSGTRLTVAN